jgi:hypothetical protein
MAGYLAKSDAKIVILVDGRVASATKALFMYLVA